MKPTIAETSTKFDTANTNIHTVTIPTGTQSGDMLLALIAYGNVAPATVTMPTSWVLVGSVGATQRLRVHWKQATDTDAGATLTASTSGSTRAAIALLRIIDVGSMTKPIETAVVSQNSTATPDPPSLTVTSFPGNDILFIAATGVQSGKIATAFPTNYSGNQTTVSASAGVGLSYASRVVSATTENPGTFTMDSSATAGSITIAIRPAVTDVRRLVIDKEMFGATIGRLSYDLYGESFSQLNDARMSVVDRNVTDFLFLFDTAVLSGTAVGNAEYDLPFTDKLFLLSTTVKERLSFMTDGVLLYDVDYRDTVRQSLDTLFLNDTALTSADRVAYAIDYLLLGHARISEQLDQNTDAMLLLDGRISDVAHGVLDTMLLNDTASATVERIVEALDKLFLFDYTASFDHLATMQDKVLLDDTYTATLERVVQDTVFLLTLRAGTYEAQQSDSVLLNSYAIKLLEKLAVDHLFLNDLVELVRGVGETILTFTDNVLLFDERISELDKQVFEHLLLVSIMTKVLDRLDQEGVLLRDSVLAERLVTVLAIDYLLLLVQSGGDHDLTAQSSLLLNDDALKDMAFAKLEQLLLGSGITREHLMLVHDMLLLYENTIIDAGLERRVVDSLLLGSDSLRDLSKLVQSYMLLDDSVTREQAATLIIYLLVHDTAGKDRDMRTVDELLLDSQGLRDRSLITDADRLLLGDDAFRDLARAALDQVLLGSAQVDKTLEIRQVDHTLFDDLIIFARDMLQREGLLLGDLSSLILGAVSTSMITHARIAAKRLLAPSIDGRDVLSRRIGASANVLDRTLSRSVWRMYA